MFFNFNFMKKLRSFRILLCVFFVASMFSACNKSENLSPEATSPIIGNNARIEENIQKFSNELPKVKNGRLIFKDWKHFVGTWQSLNTVSLEEIKSWEDGLKFYSLRSFNKDTTNAPHFKEYKFPDGYEAVINPDGEVQIGNIISIFKDGYKYFMFDKYEAELGKLKNNQLQANEEKAKGIVKAKFPTPTGITEKVTSNGRVEGSAVLGGNQFREMIWEYSTNITYRITFGLINRLDLQPYLVDPGIVVGWDSYLETYVDLGYWRRNFWGQWNLVGAGEYRDQWIRNLNINAVPPTTGGTVSAPPSIFNGSIYGNTRWVNQLGFASGTINYTPTWNIINFSGDYEMRVYPHYNQYAPHTSNKSIGLYREPAFFQ